MPLVRLNEQERAQMGERLRAARWRASMTMRAVADALHVNLNSVAGWERGVLPVPDTRAKLAVLYDVDPDVLFAELADRAARVEAMLTRRTA